MLFKLEAICSQAFALSTLLTLWAYGSVTKSSLQNKMSWSFVQTKLVIWKTTQAKNYFDSFSGRSIIFRPLLQRIYQEWKKIKGGGVIPIRIYWEIQGKWGWPANKFTHSESTLEILPKIPSMIFLLKIYFLASCLSLNYLLFCVILLNLSILYPHPSTSDTLLASPQALLMLWYSQFFYHFHSFLPPYSHKPSQQGKKVYKIRLHLHLRRVMGRIK